MQFHPLFRIYSFHDKQFHYFTADEGAPQGIYGGVSEPQVFAQFRDVLTGKEIFIGDIVRIFLSGNHYSDPPEQLGRYEVVFEYNQFMLKVCGEDKNWLDSYCVTEREAIKRTVDPSCPKWPCLIRDLCPATVIGNIFEKN
jgi:hypothetical protein